MMKAGRPTPNVEQLSLVQPERGLEMFLEAGLVLTNTAADVLYQHYIYLSDDAIIFLLLFYSYYA